MLGRRNNEDATAYNSRMIRLWRRFQIAFAGFAAICLAWLFLLPIILQRPWMFHPTTRDFLVVVILIVVVLNVLSTEIVVRYFRKQIGAGQAPPETKIQPESPPDTTETSG